MIQSTSICGSFIWCLQKNNENFNILLPLLFKQKHLGTPFSYAQILIEIEFYEILFFF